MTGQYRHLPWSEQPHVKANPRFPYGKGLPSFTGINESHIFALNDRVIPASDWMRREVGAESAMVIGTRIAKYFRREREIPQVMIADLPGKWFAAGHFKGNENAA